MGFFDFLKREEFARISELEKQVAELNTELDAYAQYKTLRDIDKSIEESALRLTSLNEECARIEKRRDSLKAQVSSFVETIELAEWGFYQRHFSFDTSEEFKQEIEAVRAEQKEMIKDGDAVTGGGGIKFNGSLSQGAVMVKRVKKLMLRAFNGEADSFIASVDWNNIDRMEQRLEKSYKAINSTYDRQGVSISYRYYCLKLDELRLTHEYKQKKQEEKEEQRAIREQMREEERALREAEQARIKAEKEERIYIQALEKARLEMGKAVGEKQAELLAKIAELEAGLLGVETLKQKAISMAQQTKMGYVYVISNVGSFGDDVYKIGMTRRLEPMDRVRELGDASVPFAFDVHAMIFSENAPELEAILHREFEANRVNLVNARREFFSVSLDRVKEVATRHGAKVEFTMIAEAEEYRESQRIRLARQRGCVEQGAT